MRTAIQLYSLRTVETPLPELVERVGAMGYDGVEFAYRVPDADADRVTAAMDRAGVRPAGAHVPLERFEDLEATVDAYRSLGCPRLVVPYLPADLFADADGVARAATRLADLARALGERDLPLDYHNHDHEFTPLGDRGAYDALVASTPATVGLQVDVGLAARAGVPPADLLARHADRLASVHLKDYHLDSGRPAHLGDGDVPIEDCLAAARAANVEWAIVEFEESEIPVRSAERSLATLTSFR